MHNTRESHFAHKKIVNIYIVYEINLWPFRQDDNFTLGNALFGVVKLAKNADKDKCKNSGNGIGFNNHRTFSLSIFSGFGWHGVIFRADMSSSLHVDNKKKNILIPGKEQKDGLDNTTEKNITI